MKRDAAAIRASHVMDPERRELYVEGARDARFLTWLAADRRDNNVRIVPAEFVDVPTVLGGNRGRLVQLAEALVGAPIMIRIFVDADFDRILGIALPPNVTLTDLRDVESYLLNDLCMEKMLRLGLNCDKLEPSAVVLGIAKTARRLGVLRLTAIKHQWDLPFRETDLLRYVLYNGVSFSVKEDAFLTTLFQNARHSRKLIPDFLSQADEVAQSCSAIDDLQLSHGKDVVTLLRALCMYLGCVRDAAEPLLWTSVERAQLEGWPALRATVNFVCAT